MGWTYRHRPKGQSIRDFLTAPGGPYDPERLVDLAVCGRMVAYAAYRRPIAPTWPEVVLADVVLLGYSRDHLNTGYKIVPETWGPTEDRCPQRIIDQLTPLDDLPNYQGIEWAGQWRDRCEANNRRRQE